MRWAVGLTSAWRQSPTIETSLSSIQSAGWKTTRVFAEPGSQILSGDNSVSGHSVCERAGTLGAFPNWYLGMTELYLREPLAEAFLMFQDDVMLAANTREYVERTLWPAPEVGVVSLYCPSQEHVSGCTGYKRIDSGWDAWGALAYVFSNPGLRAFLSDLVVLNHRHHGPAGGLRNIDSVVGNWCQRVGLPYFVHVPSLVQHIGATSTIWRRGQASGNRCAHEFDREFVTGWLGELES